MEATSPGGWRSPALARRLAIGQAVAFAVALGFLTRWRFQPWRDLATRFPAVDPDRVTTDAALTIYPAWIFWLAGAGVVMAGLAAVWTSVHRLRSASLVGGATVLASMVLGTGLVAWRHWRPAFGIQGSFAGDLEQLTSFAVGLTVAGVVAVALGVSSLGVRGAFTWEGSPWATATLCLAGLVVIFALPAAVVALDSQLPSRAVTVFGAAGVSYSGPWGASIIASAWLRPRVARAVLSTVAASAALTAFGPHVTVLTGDVWPALAATAVVALCLVPVPRRAPEWRVPPDQRAR